ncbi:MAG TPA: cobalamin biosynthesis protein CobW [Candidatus Sulfotelmatobacter sp.]|nr:cobalamin biosynthesis protein CobW [Candidatus Sulfotelmatobacter sp.]
MRRKIVASVVTGFLGAGKTTLIRHLLAQAGGRRLALIVNEFGDVGIDGDLLAGCGDGACAAGDIIELANGCICCTVADDFLPTMQALIERPDPPEHIVIETSGLALPKPLVQAFNWPEIRTRVTVDGVITVVDAAAVADGRFAADPAALAAQRAADQSLDHDEPLEELFTDQLACADMVVLNKADLLDAPTREAVRQAIEGQLRTGVKLLAAEHGRLDIDVLLGLGAGAEADLANRPSHHDGERTHDHDDFASFSVALAEIASPEALLARLKPLIARHDILRVKGFLAVAGKSMRLVLQGVGSRLQHYYDRDWQAEEARRGVLVVIGQRGLDEAAIRAALTA